MVKRFLTARSGGGGRANRYAPETESDPAQFDLTPRKAIAPDKAELDRNPRARSAQPARGPAHGRARRRGFRQRHLHARTPRTTLMRTMLYMLTTLAVIGLAFWAYRENYATQQALKETSRLHAEMREAHARLTMLRAEWAYLNRPDRLRELADLNFDRLRLLPLRPQQFGLVDEVAYPRDPLLPILGAIDLSSANGEHRP